MNCNIEEYKNLFRKYTELRIQRNENILISMYNGQIIKNSYSSIAGTSARVYDHKCSGFSSLPNIENEAIKQVIKQAEENYFILKPAENIIKKEIANNHHKNEIVQNVMQKADTNREKIIEFLKTLNDYIMSKYKDLSSVTIIANMVRSYRNLVTSDSLPMYAFFPRSNIFIVMSITENKEVFSLFESYGGLGYFCDLFDKVDQFGAKIALQYENLKKKACGVYTKAGMKDVILDGEISGLFIHESIGHTTEADFVASNSVAKYKINQMVANPVFSVTDFAHTAFGASCPVPLFFDDEGTISEDLAIIDKGCLMSFIHNKETAGDMGVRPSGNARADLYSDIPIIRMRNTAILPGKDYIEQMISSIDDGYYLIKPGNGEADTNGEFLFSVSFGYEIKNGKLGKAIKDTAISGNAFNVLQSISMVSGNIVWNNYATCCKSQIIPVGFGGPAVKCKVTVGGL